MAVEDGNIFTEILGAKKDIQGNRESFGYNYGPNAAFDLLPGDYVAVASFDARQGLLSSKQMIIDTEPVRVDGSGTINLRDETLDLRLQGKPKHFQLVRLRAPITLSGSWGHPALGVKAGPAVAQGGIGAALGLLNPFAAILAFIDPGLAKDANCGPLLSEAKAQGAPV